MLPGMINLGDISYVRLGTRDLDAATRFACQVVGLELARTEGGSRYFRSDRRDHTLVYYDGDPADQTVGFELEDLGARSRQQRLGNAGGSTSARGLRLPANSAACRPSLTSATSGNSIDLVAGPARRRRALCPARGGDHRLQSCRTVHNRCLP